MFRKIIIILILLLIVSNIFSLEINQFPDNETQTTTGDIAKMKGDLTLKIQQESGRLEGELKVEIRGSEEKIIKLIEERTNPFLINMPSMILIIIFGLIWIILKARGKV